MTMISFFASIFFVLISLAKCEIIGHRKCGDPFCAKQISEGKTLLPYSPNIEGMFLSFAKNLDVQVFSKGAGIDGKLWSVMINGQYGYVSEDFIKEQKVFVHDLNYKLPTEEVLLKYYRNKKTLFFYILNIGSSDICLRNVKAVNYKMINSKVEHIKQMNNSGSEVYSHSDSEIMESKEVDTHENKESIKSSGIDSKIEILNDNLSKILTYDQSKIKHIKNINNDIFVDNRTLKDAHKDKIIDYSISKEWKSNINEISQNLISSNNSVNSTLGKHTQNSIDKSFVKSSSVVLNSPETLIENGWNDGIHMSGEMFEDINNKKFEKIDNNSENLKNVSAKLNIGKKTLSHDENNISEIIEDNTNSINFYDILDKEKILTNKKLDTFHLSSKENLTIKAVNGSVKGAIFQDLIQINNKQVLNGTNKTCNKSEFLKSLPPLKNVVIQTLDEYTSAGEVLNESLDNELNNSNDSKQFEFFSSSVYFLSLLKQYQFSHEKSLLRIISNLNHDFYHLKLENESLQKINKTNMEEKLELADEIKMRKEECMKCYQEISDLENKLKLSSTAYAELNQLVEFLKNSHNSSDNLMSVVKNLQEQINKQQDIVESFKIRMLQKEKEKAVLTKQIDDLCSLKHSLEQKLIKSEQNDTAYKNCIRKLENAEKELQDEKLTSDNLKEQCLNLKAQLVSVCDQLDLEKNISAELKDYMSVIEKNFNGGSEVVFNYDKIIEVSKIKRQLDVAFKKQKEYLKQLQDEQMKLKSAEDEKKKISEEFSLFQKMHLITLKEKLEVQTKLEVLTNYFKDKETELQRELGLYQIRGTESSNEACSLNEKLLQKEEEVVNLKLQLESFKKELRDQEISFHNQISVQEKKAHENWLAARQAERKLEELKKECGLLRSRLTLNVKTKETSINEDVNYAHLVQSDANNITSQLPLNFPPVDPLSLPVPPPYPPVFPFASLPSPENVTFESAMSPVPPIMMMDMNLPPIGPKPPFFCNDFESFHSSDFSSLTAFAHHPTSPRSEQSHHSVRDDSPLSEHYAYQGSHYNPLYYDR